MCAKGPKRGASGPLHIKPSSLLRTAPYVWRVDGVVMLMTRRQPPDSPPRRLSSAREPGCVQLDRALRLSVQGLLQRGPESLFEMLDQRTSATRVYKATKAAVGKINRYSPRLFFGRHACLAVGRSQARCFHRYDAWNAPRPHS